MSVELKRKTFLIVRKGQIDWHWKGNVYFKKYVELFEGVANVDLQLAENCEESVCVSVFVCMCVFAQCCGY